jgi:hypothetical protein
MCEAMTCAFNDWYSFWVCCCDLVFSLNASTSSWFLASREACSACIAIQLSVCVFPLAGEVLRALHFILQRFDLRVGIVDQLVHLLTQCIVLLRQAFREVLLVDYFLRRLVAMKSQATARTLHDGRRTESTEHRSLVVFRRIETCNNHIIWVVERGAACWTGPLRIG